MAKRISENQARELFLRNGLKPLVSFPGSQLPWKSRCVRTNKIISPTYGKVRDFGHRCIHCSRSTVSSKDATALMLQKGFLPLVPFPGTNTPWELKCKKCKEIVVPTYWSIARGGGCKYCAKRAVAPSKAIAAMKARGFSVLEPYPGSTKYWKVSCDYCNRSFKTKFHSLNTNKRCQYCQRSQLDPNEIDSTLATLHLKSLEQYPGARTPWKLQCKKCKKTFERRYEKLTRTDREVHGCPYCSRKRVDPNFAVTWMKKVGVEPLTKYPGGKKPWKCRCRTCKETIYPRWDDVRRGQGACSNCADFGLNYSKPGYLYLITNPHLNSHKIGITNSYKSRKFDDRTYQHARRGWRLHKRMEFSHLRDAKKIESKSLEWIRAELELPIQLSKREMPQGGWTETVDASEIDLVTIWNKVLEFSKVKK